MDRRARVAWLLALALLACGRESRPAIRVDGHIIHLENSTAEPWSGVEVWVNDHYRVTRASLAPGERLEIPLNAFVEAYGRRFDVTRAAVKGVEVTAISDGKPLAFSWGSGRRR